MISDAWYLPLSVAVAVAVTAAVATAVAVAVAATPPSCCLVLSLASEEDECVEDDDDVDADATGNDDADGDDDAAAAAAEGRVSFFADSFCFQKSAFLENEALIMDESPAGTSAVIALEAGDTAARDIETASVFPFPSGLDT